MIVTYIHSSSSIDQYRVQTRCRNLASAIRRTGWHKAHLLDLEDFVSNTSAAQDACLESDLIVVHRYLYGPVIRAIQSWKARGKKVLVDIDQALDLLPPDTSAYHFWNEGIPQKERCAELGDGETIRPAPIEQFRLGLRLTDGATVSSSRLLDDWAGSIQVMHVPDYINLDQYLTIKQEHPGEIWIGLRMDEDSSVCLARTGLKAALEAVCAARKSVRLILVGCDPALAESFAIPAEQKILAGARRVEEWPRLLASFDLGLAPAESEHDLRAGWQRVLEFMVMKIPWIGSDLPVHRELARYGWLVQNTPGTWERALLEMIDHIDIYRSEAAGEPFLYALGQDVNENISKVLAAYATVLYRS